MFELIKAKINSKIQEYTAKLPDNFASPRRAVDKNFDQQQVGQYLADLELSITIDALTDIVNSAQDLLDLQTSFAKLLAAHVSRNANTALCMFAAPTLPCNDIFLQIYEMIYLEGLDDFFELLPKEIYELEFDVVNNPIRLSVLKTKVIKVDSSNPAETLKRFVIAEDGLFDIEQLAHLTFDQHWAFYEILAEDHPTFIAAISARNTFLARLYEDFDEVKAGVLLGDIRSKYIGATFNLSVKPNNQFSNELMIAALDAGFSELAKKETQDIVQESAGLALLISTLSKEQSTQIWTQRVARGGSLLERFYKLDENGKKEAVFALVLQKLYEGAQLLLVRKILEDALVNTELSADLSKKESSTLCRLLHLFPLYICYVAVKGNVSLIQGRNTMLHYMAENIRLQYTKPWNELYDFILSLFSNFTSRFEFFNQENANGESVHLVAKRQGGKITKDINAIPYMANPLNPLSEPLKELQQACEKYHDHLQTLKSPFRNQKLVAIRELEDILCADSDANTLKLQEFSKKFATTKNIFKLGEDSFGRQFVKAIGHILASIGTVGLYPLGAAAYSYYKRGTPCFWRSHDAIFLTTAENVLDKQHSSLK